MRKLKVAVIGCGAISGMHLEAICALKCTELTAVCDIREERACEVSNQYGGKVYTDYKVMFEKEELDAVHICLPHYLHTVVAMEAFKQGIHVLSEKPMSIRYEDAVEAVELAEKCGVQYGIIFQCRYNTPAIHVKKRIADGRLGKVQCARVVLTSIVRMSITVVLTGRVPGTRKAAVLSSTRPFIPLIWPTGLLMMSR